MPENGAIKFFESIDMDKIYKKDGKIEGFYDFPVAITGKFQSISLICLINSNGFLIFNSKN